MHPNDGRVVSNFIVQALNNRDLTIYGDGQQTRSFCYVDDLIRCMTEFMDRRTVSRDRSTAGTPAKLPFWNWQRR
jgi:UDP-glucuronate decarboxylase